MRISDWSSDVCSSDLEPVVDLVEALDLPVLVRDQLRPVEAALAECPTIALGIVEVLTVMRGVGQELLRDAADIDAGPAEITLLGDCDPGAVIRREPARAHAAGTGADGEEVVIVLRHASSLR